MTAQAVLVVGGSSGIGLATAKRLAADGHRLALMARRGAALDEAAAEVRAAGAAEVVTITADVGQRADVERAVQTTVAAFGRLDVVVHTATVMAYGTIEEMPTDVFTTVVDTAVHGTLHLAQVVLPRFRAQQSGNLIVVNSLLGSITVPNMGAYSTAKWGQRAIARTLQQEVQGEAGVHVCIVSPGSTNTPIYYQAANYMAKQARPPGPVLQPERAADAIAGLIERPRKHVSIPVGPFNPIAITGFRLLPFVYDRIVSPLFKVAALTREDQVDTTGNVDQPMPRLERVFGRWPERRS